MKKLFTILFCVMLGISAIAQQKIQLRSADRAECTKSDITSLKASFSFSTIETEEVATKGGDYSWISMPNTVLGGNAGEPQIPVINELIAVPMGAEPTIMVTNYTASEYNLADLGIKTIVPRQLPVRKNQDPEDMPFVMSQAAYQTNGLTNEPKASVEVLGTMRGVRLGNMTIEPVSYDPVNNIIRVFNNIEVEVSFNGADAKGTEDLLVNTYSEPFNAVYGTLFNNRAVTDVYDQHPDLYNTPVKMLVICYSGFKNNSALNSWLQWKLQKGYYVDIFYTDETGTTASAIASFIKTKYNASVSAGNAYTYLIVIGDTGQVPQYMTKNIDSDIGQCASDLGYSSVNFSSSTTNYFPDMYYSRISVENTTQLTSYINKVLTYEKYEFTDGGNYLNNVLLVGGWDSNWTARVAKPTINYGKAYYFNTSNTTYGGFGSGTINAVVSTSSSQGYSGSNNGVYNGINNGACLVNYTAHGDKQEWQVPQFTAAQAATLTNTGKYFFCIGNCCLTGNFNNTTTSYSPGSTIGTTASFGETMMRVPNAGAIAYIGCSPYSYWYEDFYWAVGAHSYSQGNYPTTSASSTGVYDAMFNDANWNSASALLYLGNLAVQQAVTNGNDNSGVTDGNCNNSAHYYFQFYHTFGDGSIMPYITKPETNTVTIPSTVNAGATSVTINALAGSYVAVTDNSSTIYGVAEANSSGVATVTFDNAIPASGTLYVVVTRQQYQPYFGTIEVQGGTQYTITANANNAAWGTVTGGGQYYNNTECTLTATANHGYAFDKWSDNNTDNPRTITVTGNATYTAIFRQLTEHHCTYTPQQTNGTIAVSTPGGQLFAGDIVTLIATPAPGFCLDEWFVFTNSKARIPVENNQFVMPDDEVTISATFKSGYTITVATVANGTISADPTSAMAGDLITLSATPDSGYELQCWVVYKTGDATTTMTVTGSTFTMPAYDVTVSAIFNTPTNTEVTIGSGTSTTDGNNLPTNVYYNYSLSQQIYTAAELGEAGTITAISFYYSGSTVGQRSSMDIYMSHTTSTSLSTWVTESASNLVFSGGHAFSTGWNTITLDTPFAYNGTNNILLTVDDNTGSYGSVSSSQYFYTYSTGGTRAVYYRNDNNNPSATSSNSYSASTSTSNAQLKITKVLPVDDNLTVSPNSLEGFTYIEAEGPSEAQAITITGHVSNNVTVTAPTHYEVSTALNGTYSNTLTIPVSSKGNRSTQNWDFEDGFDGWTTIDANGDGKNWERSSIAMAGYTVSTHSGSDALSSASYDGGAITPDNWLVSPQVPLGGSFTMWAMAQDASYPAEHFGIYVSTTGNTNTSDFTLLYETTLTAKGTKSGDYLTRGNKGNRDSGAWYDFTVDLSSYADQYGYIAVRHFGCTDQFYLNVDDFTLEYTGTMPVTPTNPYLDVLTANVYVRLKADLEADEYNETLTVSSGSLSSNVTLSGEVLPNSSTQYTITVVADPTEGGTVTGGGTYYEGSHRTLTATPATHYTFTGWRLNGSIVSTDNPYTITVTGDATYTAVFTPMTQHSITLNQVTGGTISASPAAAYMGDVVTLAATASSGYFFESWNVVDASNNVITVTSNQFTMPDSNVTVTASFTEGYNVTLNQTEHGTISADVTTNLAPGTVVTLTQTPDANCVFMAWYVFKTGNPKDVIAVVNDSWFFMPSSDVTVRAIFVTEETHDQTIGSGTGTSNGQYLPIRTDRNTNYYSMSQQIYTADEIGYNGRITAIAFKANGDATRTLDIYMKHTSSDDFSSTTAWEVMGSTSSVYSGSVSFVNGWATINLTTPFEYNGTDNLLICVADRTHTTQRSRTFSTYGSNSTPYRALYVNGTSIDYGDYVGVASQLETYTGTQSRYRNQIKFTIKTPGSAESLTVSPGVMDVFSYVENHGPSTTSKLDILGVDLANDVTINAPTNFEVSLTEDDNYTSSVTVPRTTSKRGRNVQTWNFDDSTLQGWTNIDDDGDGYVFSLLTAVEGVYTDSNFTNGGYDGSADGLMSGSWCNVTGSAHALTPDNWFVSPQVTLGGSFSFYVTPLNPDWPNEHFGVYVSTSSDPTDLSSYTMINEWTMSNSTWAQYSVDLSAFAEQTGYIAIRHFNCSNVFLMKLDEFVLDTDAAITIVMPVTVTAETVFVRMKENLNPGNYSGTLTASAGTGDNLNGSVSLSGTVIAEYDVTLTASPVAGGTVIGAGTYADGTSITIVADPAEHYDFVNWTENGVEVSDRSQYIFTVSADRDLVANFVLETFVITTTANPGVGGTISGNNGTYSYGAWANITATNDAASGYHFVNWTENDVEVTTNPTIEFTVTEDRNLVANFELNQYIITATADPVEGGTVTGAGIATYGNTVTLVATANEGYNFVNWTDNDEVVSTSTTFEFTAHGARELVAHFELATVTQTVTLVQGWNWWSTNLDITLTVLETALGANGVSIKDQDGNVATYRNGRWIGSINFSVGHLYKVKTNAECVVTVNGTQVSPSEVPITINPGANWIGFTGSQEVSIANAFSSDFVPTVGDKVSNSDGAVATYRNGRWIGTMTLRPGEGYIYTSMATDVKTLTFND